MSLVEDIVPQEEGELSNSAQQNPEEVKSKIDKELLSSLMEMGFGEVVSEKALYYTLETATIEAAIAWIDSNQADENYEKPLTVEEIDKTPKLSPEEAEQKAYELQKRLRDERKQREKEEALEKERLRLKQTKEILEQNAKLEEEQRKRNLQLLEKQKEDHKKERERQRELMRIEYRARFGKDPEELDEGENATKTMKPKERVAFYLNSMSKANKDTNPEGLKVCFRTLKAYLANARDHPDEPKYFQIKKENNAFKTRVLPIEGSLEVLDACGFKDKGEYLGVDGQPDYFVIGQGVKFIDVLLSHLD